MWRSHASATHDERRLAARMCQPAAKRKRSVSGVRTKVHERLGRRLLRRSVRYGYNQPVI